MFITINLYDGVANFPIGEARRRISGNNPIIFIIPRNDSSNVFELVSISERCNRYVYIVHDMDITNVFAYLASFENLDSREVMIMSPKSCKKDIKQFSVALCTLINNYTNATVMNKQKSNASKRKLFKFNNTRKI